MEFYETRGGHEFYYGTMPRIAKALEKIADALERVEVKPETTSGMSRDRAMELLNDIIDDVMVGNSASSGIKVLVSNYGFTGDELVNDFGFGKQVVEDAIGEEVTDLRTWTAENEAERRAKI